MMHGFSDANTRLARAAERIEALRPCIKRAAADRQASDALRIDLAEVVEHLNAALDYCAQELYQHFGSPPKQGRPPRVYFPVVPPGGDFRSVLGKNIHGLMAARPDIARFIQDCQVSHCADNQWLCDLRTLATESKHAKLNVQDVRQRRALRVGRPGILVPEGGSVTIENVSIGGHVIKGPEKIDVDHPPSDFDGPVDYVTQPILVWTLEGRHVEVIGFLLHTRNGVRRIIDVLTRAVAGEQI